MERTEFIGQRRLELVVGDITDQSVDTIVNAASRSLRGGGGVDGAIHWAAGPGLLAELRNRYPAGTDTGTAVPTAGHDLAARWVIHAVGPVYRGGLLGEAEALASAYRSSLRVADELGARTVACPAISLGAYGYPAEAGSRIAVDSVMDHLAGETAIELVRFVLFSDDTFVHFDRALDARVGT